MNLRQFVKTPSLLMCISCGVLFSSLLDSAFAAEIYVSTNVNGIQKWSTQAVDETYTKASIMEDQPFQSAKSLNANVASTKSIVNKRKTTIAARIELVRTINQVSIKYGVDPELVEALISVESGFNTNAISPKGARGLMQLMPATATRYGMKNVQELHVASKNIDIGVRHLKDLLSFHNGQVALVIAAYNAGQGAVSKHGQRIPGYRETMLYVPAVMAYMAHQSDSVRSAE